MTKRQHCFVADCARLELTDSTQQQTSVEGYLMLPARIARSGLQSYRASELGLQDNAEEIIRVYRPEEEVFDEASMASFGTKPVTLDHPPTMVDPASFKDYAVGFSAQKVERKDDHLCTELVVMDEEAITAIEAGKVELSIGYFADYEFEPGVTPEGEDYDAVQRNIKGNHIALVDAGRCGGSCRVEAPGTHSEPIPPAETAPEEINTTKDQDMTVLTIDGQSIELADEAAHVVQDLLDRKATLESEIAALSTIDVDALVEERLTLVEIARSRLPTLDRNGLDNKALRSAVLQGLFEDEDFSSKSEDYQNARLDALKAQPDFLLTTDKFGTAFAVPEYRADARHTYLNSLTSSWKGR